MTVQLHGSGHAVGAAHLRSFVVDQAKTVADAALAFLAGFNRRTLDMIASRIYFYFSLAHERTDSLAAIRRCAGRQPPAGAVVFDSCIHRPKIGLAVGLPCCCCCSKAPAALLRGAVAPPAV